ncbi:hypothetical protein BDFB_009915, partial [Asbolus verrucosus]
MEKDMDWVWKRGADGFIEGNGRRVLRDVMALDSPIRPLLSTKELGRTVYKTDTDRKRTLTM